ncbi:GNAT family N-acetyltransferase [Intrasporangium sp.]|uniref:GNAT family N-acetyltransferase n=1 Tax=Intrasporangium sp. TaxID=1925024 RepID=UPI00293B399F|nr:GNAT family N-acetyltransferase [Intrasporangium sp.]MDV3221054.1 GNAT family N-acetyltransferase [Intrasporangium sp.]
MVKRIRVIGIGLGSPLHLTREAVGTLRTVDVLVLLERGPEAGDRVAAKRALCAEVVPDIGAHRVVEVTDHQPEDAGGRDSAAYDRGVTERLVEAGVDALTHLAPEDEAVGVLAWGDPVLGGPELEVAAGWGARLSAEVDVVAGVGAPQLVAAAHRLPLGAIRLLTGTTLVDEYDPALGDVAVVLDDDLRGLELAELHPDLQLHWGTHVGTPDEVLVSGRLADVADEVREARVRARESRGWVIDTYLLRREGEEAGPAAKPWPDVQSISDGVLSLRPVTTTDWDLLLAENNNAEAMRWGFTSEPMTEQEARRAAARAVRDWRSGRAARFVMVDEATGLRMGMLSVIRMGPPGVGVVGYGVLPEFRGRGVTVRGLELLVEWVFTTTSLGRLELGHKVGNTASGIVAERAGFVREGVLAGRLVNPDGTYSDEVSYGRLRP